MQRRARRWYRQRDRALSAERDLKHERNFSPTLLEPRWTIDLAAIRLRELEEELEFLHRIVLQKICASEFYDME